MHMSEEFEAVEQNERSKEGPRARAASSKAKAKNAFAESPLVEVRRSPIQGRGVFAKSDIAKGTRILEYLGERISPQEADRRYDDEASDRHHTFLFVVDKRCVIDAARLGNEARYINHSCSPNCEAVVDDRRIFIDALVDIDEGTELAYDYSYVTDEAYSDADRRRLYPCRCGTKDCRGTIARLRDAEKAATKAALPAKRHARSSRAKTAKKGRR
jgi:hypothetical protein